MLISKQTTECFKSDSNCYTIDTFGGHDTCDTDSHFMCNKSEGCSGNGECTGNKCICQPGYTSIDNFNTCVPKPICKVYQTYDSVKNICTPPCKPGQLYNSQKNSCECESMHYYMNKSDDCIKCPNGQIDQGGYCGNSS